MSVPRQHVFCQSSGEKIQKRRLNAHLSDLFLKYEAGSPQGIGYVTFCVYKPEYIIAPKLNERDTCACITHVNFGFLIEALHNKRIIDENTTSQVVSSLVCTQRTDDCLSKECSSCLCKRVDFRTENIDLNEMVNYSKWVPTTEKRISAKTKKEIIVKLVPQKARCMSVENIISSFSSELEVFRMHVLKIFHQGNCFRTVTKNLKREKCAFIIDWSENRVCEYFKPVHQMHFGANQEQFAMNTGVFYMEVGSQGFATLSKNLKHDAQAITAHIIEPLTQLLLPSPNIGSERLR